MWKKAHVLDESDFFDYEYNEIKCEMNHFALPCYVQKYMIIVSYTKIIETLLESLHVSMPTPNARDPTLEYGSLAYRVFFR